MVDLEGSQGSQESQSKGESKRISRRESQWLRSYSKIRRLVLESWDENLKTRVKGDS